MNKNYKILVASVLAFFALGASVGVISLFESRVPIPTQEPASSIAILENSATSPSYILSEYNGKLAVYIPGNQTPQLVFERYLHHLPDVDRLKLEQGIEVYDYAQLLVMIEDYTS